MQEGDRDRPRGARRLQDRCQVVRAHRQRAQGARQPGRCHPCIRGACPALPSCCRARDRAAERACCRARHSADERGPPNALPCVHSSVAAAQDSLMEDRTPDVEKKLKQMQAEKKKAEINAYVNPELAEAVRAHASTHTTAHAPHVACVARMVGSGGSVRRTCVGVAAGTRGGQHAVQGGQVPAGDRKVQRRDEAQPEVAPALLQPRRVLPEAHGVAAGAQGRRQGARAPTPTAYIRIR